VTGVPTATKIELSAQFLSASALFVILRAAFVPFAVLQTPQVAFPAAGKDTAARTYCEGTAAAIKLRMRTRL
jgi:hypothetical protein